jgi:hypothetical protein
MSGKTGFGVGGVLPTPEISEEQKAIAAGDVTALLRSMEKSLSLLARKYAEVLLEQPNLVTIAASAAVFSAKLDYSAQPHNGVIIGVLAGTLNLWLGDYSGVPQAAVPNLGQFTPGPPIQLFFGLKGRIYTLVNPSAVTDLVVSIIPVAV